jgi:aryl-alcohol dehydrogenase-like predicted oxidoreductase
MPVLRLEEIALQTRRLGKSGLDLTVIGLGTWAIGGPWQYGWGPQDDDVSVRTIRAAVEAGVNWIDTAPIYGCGHSEVVVGQALKGLSPRPLIATKCGLLWNEKREKVNCLDHDSILRECEQSLRRLAVETIDLYQVHWPVPDEQIEEAWEAMARLVEQGKVRCLGASNATVEQVRRLQKVWPVTAVQPPYSMLRRDIESELLPYCKEHGIGVVCYSPMQKGLLTGKFTKAYMQTLAPDDHRLKDPMFTGAGFERNLRIIDALRPIAQRSGKSLSHLAIAWTLRNNEVTSAIVGARKPDQIKETVAAGNWVLSTADVAAIESILGNN